MASGERQIKTGLTVLAVALLGWLLTAAVVPLVQQPRTTEDLTNAWTQAGPTPLGQSTTVAVAPGQTLVAFLVGTNLTGSAGTTSGTCTATRDGQRVDLGWPVLVNQSLTGVLAQGQEAVATAGWSNRRTDVASLQIRCTTTDSTVDHFIAVSSDTAVVVRDPWFQPWGWAALAAGGVALAGAGVRGVRRSTR